MAKKTKNNEESEDTKLTPTGLISLIFFLKIASARHLNRMMQVRPL